MKVPNMATITNSIENCSLTHVSEGSSSISGVDSPENDHSGDILELNSYDSLPYDYEQCLDLKTGKIYYINWRNGSRTEEDPRTAVVSPENGDSYYSDDDSSYESDVSSSDSSEEHCNCNKKNKNRVVVTERENVLVVAGCKSCMMYYMVPKQVGDCPKCSGQLLHFDRSDNGFP